MPRYDLNALGAEEFERLVQSLLKRVIGNGTITFGAGADGAREATFDGVAPYPSSSTQWDGRWIFQAKYHDVGRIGGGKARSELLADLRAELRRVTQLYGSTRDNYVLATNVPLSSQTDVGTHERIASIAEEFACAITNVHVWGSDELTAFLSADADVRAAFRHLLTPGDVIARLLRSRDLLPLDKVIRMFLSVELGRERNAQLDQAGDVSSENVPLSRVFTDLEVMLREQEKHHWAEQAPFPVQGPSSALRVLLGDSPRLVLIGGPGQGKSTLGQFLAQVHRATLLGRLAQFEEARVDLEPLTARIPFRVVLRDLAQWLTSRPPDEAATVEQYVAGRVSKAAGGAPVTPVEILEIVERNPTLFVFDGLDEVVDVRQRRTVLAEIEAFMVRIDELDADVQILGSSRPNSYANEFHPRRYMHLVLQPMDSTRVATYVERWLASRNLDDDRMARALENFDESAADRQLEALLTTPLQVSIVLYVILTGGRPSRQRESLLTDYVDVIYRRERAKHRSLITTEKDVVIGLHRYLGYLLQRRAGDGSNVESTFDLETFETEVRRYLRHLNPFADDEERERELRALVAEARDRLVLIVESSDRQFGFELRSLQEYFAASHLVVTADTTELRARRFRAIATSEHWRNTALFFAGCIGRLYPGEAAQLLEVCRAIDRAPPDTLVRRGAKLARGLAVDRVFGSNENLQRSAIEEGIAQLEGDIAVWDFSDSAAELAWLTPADQITHLLPALERKVDALDISRACHAVASTSYCSFDRSRLAQRLLRRAKEGSMDDRAEAIAAVLEIAPTPSAGALAFAAEADPERFGKAFSPLGDIKSFDPGWFGELKLSPQHWHRLVVRTSGRNDANIGPGDVPTTDVLDGWGAAWVVIQLNFRAIRHRSYRTTASWIETAERLRFADPVLDAARSLHITVARLGEWKKPLVSRKVLWDEAALVAPVIPSVLYNAQIALQTNNERLPGLALIDALCENDQAGFATAWELVERFHGEEQGRKRFDATLSRVSRSARRDNARRAAYLFGIPATRDPIDEELGMSLATFGRSFERGTRGWQPTRASHVTAILDRAAAVVTGSWPGLDPGAFQTLLGVQELTDDEQVQSSALHYVEALAASSGGAASSMLSESAARVVSGLMLSSVDARRLDKLLVHVHDVPRRESPLDGDDPRCRRAISRLVERVHPEEVADRAMVRGAAALIMWWVGSSDLEGGISANVEPPNPKYVEGYLLDDDPLVARAGVDLLQLLDGDSAARTVLRLLERLLVSELSLDWYEFALDLPDDHTLRKDVVVRLADALSDGQLLSGTRPALLDYLLRLADTEEPDMGALEEDLSLPLAAI